MIKHKTALCYLCNTKTNHKLYLFGKNADSPQKKDIPLLKCVRCGLISSMQQAKSLNNASQYNIQYYGHAGKTSFLNSCFQKMFNTERRIYLNLGSKVRSLLDYGCGTGDLLQSLPSRISRFGFETSQAALKGMKSKKGENIKILSRRAVYSYRYDVVTFWQSLEHIRNPIDLLLGISKILTADGFIFISVPNIQSIQSRVFRGKWFHLDPERHHVHYSANTLINMLNKANLKVESIKTMSIEYGVFGWWQSIFNCLGLEFNMGYKIIKRKVKYRRSIKNTVQKLTYIIFGLPVALASLFLALIEGWIGMGSVLQVKARPATESD